MERKLVGSTVTERKLDDALCCMRASLHICPLRLQVVLLHQGVENVDDVEGYTCACCGEHARFAFSERLAR